MIPPDIRLRSVSGLIVDGFDALWPALKSIESALTYTETYALYRLADQGGGTGVIVEIGSYLGRSAAAMGYGSRLERKDLVYTIDHHEGDPHSGYAITWNRLNRNLDRLGIGAMTCPVRSDSLSAAALWPSRRKIRLLFIDGYHTYEATKADYEAWRPHLCDGAMVAFHDYTARDGVRQFVDEMGWPLKTYDSLAVIGE